MSEHARSSVASSPGSAKLFDSHSYVLVTAARDEALFIEETIRSVVGQTVRPLKWVIVSDGSTDGTDDIVRNHAAAHPWIQLVRMPDRAMRHFAGKALAFKAGVDALADVPYAAIGNVDADISFDRHYFAYLLRKLAANPALGVVGTRFTDATLDYDYRFVNIDHVSGPCQLFRRVCFEDIGGYVPSALGGVDHIAVVTARMKGWQTRTFLGQVFVHNRAMGSQDRSILAARFRTGAKDYALGGHPLWQICRTVYQMRQKPYFSGATMLMAGYITARVLRIRRPVTPEVVQFHRHEQMQRLKKFVASAAAQAANTLTSVLVPRPAGHR